MGLSLEPADAGVAQDHPRASSWIFRGVVLLVFAILLAQLWRLQIVDGRAYAGRSAANWLRSAIIPPERGVIYDRNKAILASNAPIFVVSITPADVPRDKLPEIVIRVANELRVPPKEIQQVLDTRMARRDYSPYNAVAVRRNVDRDAIMRISEHALDMPGVQVSVDSTRRYAEGDLVAHLVGYMGAITPEEASQLADQGYSPEDRIGAAGLEEWYEKDLRGVPGKRLYQVEVTGQEVAELRRDPAQPGRNLQLTLDLELQRDVTRILQEGLKKTQVGAAVVMDPRNGDILALVSLPTFDNNIIGDPSREDELERLLTDDVQQPMFPRAFAATYAPGSVFKLVTGSAALQEGVATRDTVIDSPGVVYVEREGAPGVRDKLVDTAAWGPQTFLQGMANSSNVYFFFLGGGYSEGNKEVFHGLGAENLARYARGFGYGTQTGLDVPGERDGLIPDPRWKQLHTGERWFTGDTYNMSIGQGDVLTTPIQVANVTNAIANGGTLYQPHLGKALLDNDGNVVRVIQPTSRTVPVDPANLQTMREGMEFTFTRGPWLKPFVIPGLRVAGKTGTAEYPGPLNERGDLPTHGWFTGFAPADDPQVSVTVFVDQGGGSGDASPIAARIIRRYFHLPDSPVDAPVIANPQPAPPAPPPGVQP